MKLNLYILLDALCDCNCQYLYLKQRADPLTLNLDTVCLYEASILAENSTLYIATEEEYRQIPDTYKHLPFVVLGSSSDAFTPFGDILYLKTEFDRYQIFNRLIRIFQKYSNWHETLLIKIAQSVSFQDFFDCAASVFPNPILLVDSSYFVILTAGKLPISYEENNFKFIFPDNYFSLSNIPPDAPQRSYEQLASCRRAFWAQTDLVKYPYIDANIYIDNHRYAEMSMEEIWSPLSFGQLALFEVLRELVCLLFRNDIHAAHQMNENSIIISQILSGEPVKAAALQHFLKIHHWSADGLFRLIVFHCPFPQVENTTLADLLLPQIQSVFSAALIFTFSGDIIVILREKDYFQEKARCFDFIQKLLSKSSFLCGVSTPYLSFMDLKYAYQQCLSAISFGYTPTKKNSVFMYKHYYQKALRHALQTSSNPAPFCDSRIRFLQKYDQENNSELFKTFHAFLLLGMSTSKTAEVCNMHRNTVKYRIEKIQDLTGIDTEKLNADGVEHLLLSCFLLG